MQKKIFKHFYYFYSFVKKNKPVTTVSMGSIAFFNLINAMLGVAFSSILAFHFGVLREIETFYAAYSLATICINLSQAEQLSDIFMPFYLQMKYEHGSKAAHKLFSTLINWVALLLIFFSCLLWLFSMPLIKLLIPGFSVSDHLQGIWMFRFLLPFIFLNVINYFLAIILNAEGMFGRPESSITIAFIFKISIVFFFFPQMGIWSLPLSICVAMIIQLSINLVSLFKLGYRHSLGFSTENINKLFIIRRIVSTSFSVWTSQIYLFVQNSVLSFLPQGTYAIYKYCQNLFYGTSGIALLPISKVFFVSISKSLAQYDDNINYKIEQAISRSFGLVLIVYISIILSAKPLLILIWYNENFNIQSLDLATKITIVLFGLLFFQGFNLIWRGVALALGYVHQMYFLLTIVYIIGSVCTWFISKAFLINGFLLSHAITLFLTSLVPLIIIKVKTKNKFLKFPFQEIFKWVISFIPSFILIILFKNFSNFYVFPTTRFYLIINSFFTFFSFCSIAIVFAYFFKVKDVVRVIEFFLVNKKDLNVN